MSQGFSTTSFTSTANASAQTYDKYDLWLDAQGLLQWDGEGAQNSTQTLDLQPPQQDVGQNPNEIPSALGRFFTQSDFSHGSGQPFFHRRSSDVAKVYHLEGFNISKPGILEHLNAVNLNGAALTGGRVTQAGNSFFVADGTTIRRYADITAASTADSPHVAEAATTVRDLTAEGARVFAALGTNGIHVRSSAGTWTHHNDAQAILVRYVKQRIMAASATAMYQITASGAAPTPLLTLAEGWTFTDIGENGPYIYATAVNEAAGLSTVHHFGLDSSLALQHTGSTPLPDNDLAYSFKGYLGMVFIGCGRKNAAGGKDALWYRAEPSEAGFLNYALIQDSEGAGTRDLSVRAMATYGRRILAGWTLGQDSPFGEREGLALYDPALDAFVHHLASSTSTTTPDPVLGVAVFGGRIVFTTADGVYYEDTTKRVSEATMVTSISNWNNAGLKDHDQTAINHKSLPATSSVDVQYTTVDPEDGVWAAAGTSSTANSNGETFKHPGVKSQQFALRIISHSTQSRSDAPEIESFSTRANPTLASAEYQLVRTVKIFDEDRSGISSTKALVRQDPQTVRDFIRGRAHSWCQLYEADDATGYTVRLVKFQELDMHSYRDADGNSRTDGYFLVLVFEGTRNA